MEYWFIFLECSQRDFGQLTNDLFFSPFTQTDMTNVKQTESEPRQGVRNSTHVDGCHCVPWDGGGPYLRKVSGQGPHFSQKAVHR